MRSFLRSSIARNLAARAEVASDDSPLPLPGEGPHAPPEPLGDEDGIADVELEVGREDGVVEAVEAVPLVAEIPGEREEVGAARRERLETHLEVQHVDLLG